MSEKEAGKINENFDFNPDSNSSMIQEVANQLSNFADKTKILVHSDRIATLREFDSPFPLNEKERTEAVNKISKDLEAMVKGDVPHLRQRMKELGLSTKELDELDKKLGEKVEAVKPLEDAILKGDTKALQRLVAQTKPEQLAEMAELVHKHFQRAGIDIEVDYTEGKLILSGQKADRAILIAKDKLDVIGVNADGSYDFNRHFRRENPAAELRQLADRSLTNYLYPPRWHKEPFNSSFKHSQPIPAAEIIQRSRKLQ